MLFQQQYLFSPFVHRSVGFMIEFSLLNTCHTVIIRLSLLILTDGMLVEMVPERTVCTHGGPEAPTIPNRFGWILITTCSFCLYPPSSTATNNHWVRFAQLRTTFLQIRLFFSALIDPGGCHPSSERGSPVPVLMLIPRSLLLNLPVKL